MIKQLVVGIDGSDFAISASSYAEYFAEHTGCELKFVFVIDSRKTELPIIYATGHFDYAFARTYIPPDSELKSFYQKIKKDIISFAENCLGSCCSRCEEKNIPAVSIQREGLPSLILSEEVRSGDMLVIGQKGENARFDRTIVGSTTEDIVRSSPRPILVCPKDFRAPEKLLFPYDGSITGERALQFIVNICDNFWKEFVILLAGREVLDDTCLEKELRYLNKHDISYRIMSEKGSLVDSVLNVAKRENSDIILVGSHGTQKIRDYLLGSTTSHLIRKSHLPVLIVY
ncbi:hypothetical protein ES703_88461 [subsurface metagenome]